MKKVTISQKSYDDFRKATVAYFYLTNHWLVKLGIKLKLIKLQVYILYTFNQTNNILKTGWMSMFSDDFGGVYFLQEYLKENLDPNKDVALELANNEK